MVKTKRIILDIRKFLPTQYIALGNLLKEVGRLRIDLSECENIQVDEYHDYIYADYPRASDKIYHLRVGLLNRDYGSVTAAWCADGLHLEEKNTRSFTSEGDILEWAEKLQKE